MGTGYTRNDTSNNIADGNVINASDLDGEFDAVQAAFNGSSGHSHDGTTGEGPQLATAAIADDAITSAKIDTNIQIAGTFGVTGVVTANAGVVVDNITIDGTEIDLSSGDLTVDVAGDITLDADGGDIRLSDAGTQFGKFTNSSSDFIISSSVNDKDMKFAGADGGADITALTLDMSAAGEAKFNDNIVMGTAGKGIHLGVTSATASNLLDDYEEGTFTPGLIDSAGGLGANLTTAVGQYTKVGNLVTFALRVNGNARTSTGNQVYITGLPFTFSPTTSTNRIQFELNGINLGLDSGFYGHVAQLANTDTSLTILMTGTTLENFRGHDLTPSYEIYTHGSYFTS